MKWSDEFSFGNVSICIYLLLTPILKIIHLIYIFIAFASDDGYEWKIDDFNTLKTWLCSEIIENG